VKINFSLVIFLTSLLFYSCSSASNTIATFNPDLPDAEQSRLYFSGQNIEIISFNGNVVNWNRYEPNTLVLAFDYNVIIPSGSNIIVASYRGSDATIINFRVEHYFEPGKRYTLLKKLLENELYIIERRF